MTPLVVGSLFSGIGGMDLGLERAGMRVAWQCEIDPFCRRVLAKHWPHVPCYADVAELDASALEPVDVLAGGFPCQPVSVSGRRRAQADVRWLWPDFARLVESLRPRYVLIENVVGLLSKGMRDIDEDLSALGYAIEWDVLPASFVGAPHPRERVIIVANTGSAGTGMAVFDDRRPGRQYADTLESAMVLEADGAARAEGADAGRALYRGEGWWSTESDMVRVGDGFSEGLDAARRRALGNAVVPQLAEWIGQQIVKHAAGVSHGAHQQIGMVLT